MEASSSSSKAWPDFDKKAIDSTCSTSLMMIASSSYSRWGLKGSSCVESEGRIFMC